jgi:hypothetical protein
MSNSELVFTFIWRALGMDALLWAEVTMYGLRDRKINIGFVAISAWLYGCGSLLVTALRNTTYKAAEINTEALA